MPYCTRRDYIYIPAGGRAFKSIGYSASPLAGPSPLTVTFDIFAFCYEDSNDAPTGFCIDYGDGKTETGVFSGNHARVKHTYTATSTFGSDVIVPVITVTSALGTIESHVPSETYYIYVHSGVGTIDPGGTLAMETSNPIVSLVLIGVAGFVATLVLIGLLGRKNKEEWKKKIIQGFNFYSIS